MLDSQTIATVKATIPVLAKTGPALTAHFYDRMFHHNPELKDVFNLTHQSSGAQREALFNAICAYAVNIENLAVLLPAVERIAQKHASFSIQPEQYAIVGHHLLATIDEMLSPGQEVLDAQAKPIRCWRTSLSIAKVKSIRIGLNSPAAGKASAPSALKKAA